MCRHIVQRSTERIALSLPVLHPSQLALSIRPTTLGMCTLTPRITVHHCSWSVFHLAELSVALQNAECGSCRHRQD